MMVTVEELVEGDVIELDGGDATVAGVVGEGHGYARLHYSRGRYVYSRSMLRGETFEVSR